MSYHIMYTSRNESVVTLFGSNGKTRCQELAERLGLKVKDAEPDKYNPNVTRCVLDEWVPTTAIDYALSTHGNRSPSIMKSSGLQTL